MPAVHGKRWHAEYQWLHRIKKDETVTGRLKKRWDRLNKWR